MRDHHAAVTDHHGAIALIVRGGRDANGIEREAAELETGLLAELQRAGRKQDRPPGRVDVEREVERQNLFGAHRTPRADRIAGRFGHRRAAQGVERDGVDAVGDVGLQPGGVAARGGGDDCDAGE